MYNESTGYKSTTSVSARVQYSQILCNDGACPHSCILTNAGVVSRYSWVEMVRSTMHELSLVPRPSHCPVFVFDQKPVDGKE